jgi:mannitol-specific phosphotransferase system IIBC component
MTPTTLKETDYLKAWFILWLLATVGGFFAGAVVGGLVGGLVGAILGAVGVPVQAIICSVVGFLISVPLSYVVFRFVVARFIVPKIAARDASFPPLPVT